MGRTASTEPQCLYNGALYLYVYLYSHYGPYRQYTASVPVERCTVPLPIPLLPLWAVRPVQSLSACTTVHCTFTYTSTPTMGRTASIPLLPLWAIQPVHSLSACTTVHCTLPIPLLHLWAVQPVHSLSACTTVQSTFTYTSTPTMGRTVSTQPQCLYNGALYLYLYLYSPYGAYRLYRTSVPVQRCTLALPILTYPMVRSP